MPKNSNALTGEDFIYALRQGGARDWNGCQISGDVDLTGETIVKPLVIQGAVFTGTLNLSQVRFERGVDFSGCHFHKLILSDARVEGPLTLDNVVIGVETGPIPDMEMIRQIVARLKEGCRRARSRRTDPPDERTRKRERLRRRWTSRRRWQEQLREAEAKYARQQTNTEFYNLHIAGCLSMMKASVFGGLSCDHAEIEDDLRIDGAQIYGNLSLRHTSLGELRTDGKKLFANTDADARRSEDGPCRVDGRLDLTSATISGDLRLIGVAIGGELTLQAVDINGNLLCRASERVRTRLRNGAWLMVVRARGTVDFGGTRLHGGLNLGIGNIGGNLQCGRTGKWFFTMDSDYDMPNVRVGADIDFTGCRVRGNIDLTGAKIENNVVFVGSHFEKDLYLYNASIAGDFACHTIKGFNKNARVRGDVFLSGANIGTNVSFEGAYLGGNLFLQNTSIGNTLFLRAISDLEKNIRCEIIQKAWMLGVTVAGDVDISGARIGDDLIMQNANIGQNFMAKIMGGFQSQIDGDTHLNGARIRGAVELGGAVLRGELDLDGASIDGGFTATFDLDDAADWQVKHSRVGRRIHAASATISHRVILMGLTVGPIDRAADGSTVKERGVHFLGAHIKGEFSLYSEHLVGEILQSKKAAYQAREISTEMQRGVFEQARRERTVIQGDLRLTRAQVFGDISLGGVRIEGGLDLRDANVRANINCKPIELGPDESPLRASVHWADFETLDMTGDINLTGLTVSGKPADRSDGHLILRDSRIRGRLELCPRTDYGQFLMDDPNYKDKITNIRGDLRLDAAEISHVIISGENLVDEVPIVEKNKEDWVRVGLERATVGRLQIVEPLPGTLDLSNLKVNRLDRLEDPSVYKDMLKNSHPFKKSNYLGIENALRNAGLDGQADEVHVLMRRRDRPNPLRSFWRWLLDVFLDLSIKYGTTSKRLVCVMLVWFAISVCIFSNRNHVEYDIAPQVDKPQILKRPESWSTGDAALFAARLHVPIISLGVEEKVQPSGTNLKAYAMIVVALSWVMWPLLIASASGLIRKQN
jgi:hypothetical protein